MYSLWGSTLAQNHQLASGDYAIVQGMFCGACQRHRRSTMCIEKGALPTEHKEILRQPRNTTSAAKSSQGTLHSQQQSTITIRHRQVHQQGHQARCFTKKATFTSVTQLDALVSVFRFLQSSSDFAGLNRQDARSDTTVGPKWNRITVLHSSHR